MNKQELKQLLKDSEIKGLKVFDKDVYGIPSSTVLGLIDQLDEPQEGRAEEAPRYVKNVLARLRELPLHDREVWLKAIMSEFEKDFSYAKWREGYEQGRIESMIEREKVKIPQFVADIIEEYKEKNAPIIDIFTEKNTIKKYDWWLATSLNAYDRVARAWLDGYEIEQEKRYLVKIKNLEANFNFLNRHKRENYWILSTKDEAITYQSHHTRKELEEAGLGWVFDCEGIDVEEM